MTSSFKDRILAHDAAAPRYTSYPPATAFSRDFTAQTTMQWLRALPQNGTLSLYVHIPFCARLCYYCGCHTTIANDYGRINDYLACLRREIALAATHVPRDTLVTHVHFGGGSPTMLAAADFADLLDHLSAAFRISPKAEIAIEADPRQLTRETIAAYARCGVTRISLGVQDFDDRVLAAVNRDQPYALTADSMAWAREYGIEGINIDLIYGLPFQTPETQETTLERVIALAPPRIAFFGYAHVPWMKKHMTVIAQSSLPDAGARFDLFDAGRRQLMAAGYHPVGIDHFARTGDPLLEALQNHTLHRNFQGYTTDMATALLGFGASAISSLPQGYSQNTADLRIYADTVNADRLPACRGLARTADDIARAAIIEQLMCYMTVDLATVARAHNLPETAFDTNCAALAPLVADGLATLHARTLTIHPDAPQIVRIAARAFDNHAIDSQTQRHARAV